MVKHGVFSDRPDFEARYYPDYEKLKEVIESIRKHHKYSIGLVGGVWDLIHEGHMAYIMKASEFVDMLVVGVDTDEFTRSRPKKSPEGVQRPLIPYESRARCIAYQRGVGLITRVTEDFDSVLKAVCPDVLVFSETTTDLAASKREYYLKTGWVGRIEFLPPQAPPDLVSTTARIEQLERDLINLQIDKTLALLGNMKQQHNEIIDKSICQLQGLKQ